MDLLGSRFGQPHTHRPSPFYLGPRDLFGPKRALLFCGLPSLSLLEFA